MLFSETDISLLLGGTLFKGVPPLPLFDAALRDPANQLVLPVGSVVVAAGTRAPGLHLVAHGTVELVVQALDGSEKIVDFVRTGGMFAEETLFDAQPIGHLARTLTPAAILRLPEETVDAWLAASPELSQRLISLLAARTDYMEKDLVTFCTKNATARLVCYLVCQFNRAPCTPDGTFSLTVTIPRGKLALRLGVSDSHLSRAFRELEAQGLIVQQGKELFIPDVPALSRYVCPAGCDW